MFDAKQVVSVSFNFASVRKIEQSLVGSGQLSSSDFPVTARQPLVVNCSPQVGTRLDSRAWRFDPFIVTGRPPKCNNLAPMAENCKVGSGQRTDEGCLTLHTTAGCGARQMWPSVLTQGGEPGSCLCYNGPYRGGPTRTTESGHPTGTDQPACYELHCPVVVLSGISVPLPTDLERP